MLQRKSEHSTQPPFFQPEGSRERFFGSEPTKAPFFQPAPGHAGQAAAPPTIQTKLKIGAPNDHFEKEADAVADKVVQRLAQPAAGNAEPAINGQPTEAPAVHRAPAMVQHKCADCEKEDKLQKKEEEIGQTGEAVQMKPIFDSAAEPPDEGAGAGTGGSPFGNGGAAGSGDDIRRKPIFESEGTSDDLQRKCADCEGEEQEHIQKSGDGSSEASPDVSSRLQSSKGGGSPLPHDTRSSMESAIGADFSGVRVHTGSEAAGLSQDLSAQAFTHGNDIYFNEGKYNPGSGDGQKLLAHELTHTVQQGGAKAKSDIPPKTNTEADSKIPQRKLTSQANSDYTPLKNANHLKSIESVLEGEYQIQKSQKSVAKESKALSKESSQDTDVSFRMQSDKGNESPSKHTQTEMTGAIGADFSKEKGHTASEVTNLNNDIGNREGKKDNYEQGIKQKSDTPTIQRSWVDDGARRFLSGNQVTDFLVGVVAGVFEWFEELIGGIVGLFKAAFSGSVAAIIAIAGIIVIVLLAVFFPHIVLPILAVIGAIIGIGFLLYHLYRVFFAPNLTPYERGKSLGKAIVEAILLFLAVTEIIKFAKTYAQVSRLAASGSLMARLRYVRELMKYGDVGRVLILLAEVGDIEKTIELLRLVRNVEKALELFRLARNIDDLLDLLRISKIADIAQLERLLRIAKIANAGQLRRLLQIDKLADASQLERLLGSAKLADGARLEQILSSAKLADAAQLERLLGSAKIADAMQVQRLLESAKIADAIQLERLINSTKLTNATQIERLIGSAKLSNVTQLERLIRSAKIADVTQLERLIGNAKIADAAQIERLLGSAKIADAAQIERLIASAKLADAAQVERLLGSAKLSNAVQLERLVRSAKIADATQLERLIESAKIADASQLERLIGSAKIADASQIERLLGNVKIIDAAQIERLIGNAKIADAAQLERLIANVKIADAAQLERLVTNIKLADAAQVERLLADIKITDAAQLERLFIQPKITSVAEIETILNLVDDGNRLERLLNMADSVVQLESFLIKAGGASQAANLESLMTLAGAGKASNLEKILNIANGNASKFAELVEWTQNLSRRVLTKPTVPPPPEVAALGFSGADMPHFFDHTWEFVDIPSRLNKSTTFWPLGTGNTPNTISDALGEALRNLNPPGGPRLPIAGTPSPTTGGGFTVQVGSITPPTPPEVRQFFPLSQPGLITILKNEMKAIWAILNP